SRPRAPHRRNRPRPPRPRRRRDRRPEGGRRVGIRRSAGSACAMLARLGLQTLPSVVTDRCGRESEVVVDGFTIGRNDVLGWIDRHDAAWRAADPAAIAGLFSADAVYHLGPW